MQVEGYFPTPKFTDTIPSFSKFSSLHAGPLLHLTNKGQEVRQAFAIAFWNFSNNFLLHLIFSPGFFSIAQKYLLFSFYDVSLVS